MDTHAVARLEDSRNRVLRYVVLLGTGTNHAPSGEVVWCPLLDGPSDSAPLYTQSR